MTMPTWSGVIHLGRGFWRRKGWVAMIVLPLALGLGATIAVFTIAQDVLLAPLGFPAADRLLSLRHSVSDGGATLMLSSANYLDLVSSGNPALGMIAAYQPVAATLVGEGDPLTLEAVRVSPSFFEVVAVMPQIGRPFDPSMAQVPAAEETILDHGGYIILSQHLWRSRFGGRESVLGEQVTVDERRLEVIGVMPEGFDFPTGTDAYLPLGFGEIATRDRGGYYLETIARMAEGIPLERAKLEGDAVMKELQAAAPNTNGRLGLSVVPLKDRLIDNLKTGIWLLFAISTLILLLVSANSAQLFWAQGLERQRDIAVRLALGASRGSLIRQFLSESTCLAAVASVLGVLLAKIGLEALLAAVPEELFSGREVQLDSASLPFIVAVGLFVGLVVGLAPVLALTRFRSLPRRLTEGGRSHSLGRGRKAIQDGMVVAQLALALTLVHTTFLMLASYAELRSVPLGFDPEGVVAIDATLPWERYQNEESMRLFAQQVVTEIASSPGVRSAGLGLRLPVVDGPGGIWVRTDPTQVDQAYPSTFHTIDPGFLPTLGIGVIRGRSIQSTDADGSPAVAVVNQAFARLYLSGLDPLEESITLTPWPDLRFRVVGIVRDVPQGGLRRQIAPAVYVSYGQVPMNRLRLVARVDGDPDQAVSALGKAVWRVDPHLGIETSTSLGTRLEKDLLPDRFSTTLVGCYGLLGALLAATGVFSVMAFFVESRRTEIGIRLALGSRPRSLLAWVLGRAAMRAAIGLGLGALGAVGLAIVIADQLFGGVSWSAQSLLLSLLALGGVVALAHLLPAHRAISTAPIQFLLRGQ